MQKLLQKIANTLILYSYQIENYGLIHGKMGLILYLYHYANTFHEQIYSDFADQLLDEVLEQSPRGPIDFENGLSGIGWGIHYLLHEKWIEGDPDEIFDKVDHKVFSYLQNGNPQHSMEGQGLYLLTRLKSTNKKTKFLEQIAKLLSHHTNYYKEITTPISLYHLNSFIYFLYQLHLQNIYPQQIQQIYPLIKFKLEESLSNKKMGFPDLKILEKLLHGIETHSNFPLKEFIPLKERIQITQHDMDISDFIRYSWLNLIYFNEIPAKQPDKQIIDYFITEKQESLLPNDFTLHQGLAGIGLSSIKNYRKTEFIFK